jgi:hypothetical protein
MAICYVTSSVGELLLHTLKVRVFSAKNLEISPEHGKNHGGLVEKPMRKWMNIWGIYGINGA